MKLPQIVNFGLICLISEIWTISRRQAGTQPRGLVAAAQSHGFSQVVAGGRDHLCSTCGQLGPNDPRELCFASPALWPPDLLWGLSVQGYQEARSERRSLQRGLGFPFRMLRVYRCTARSCSKLLGEKDAVAVLFTVTPRPGLPLHMLECMHTQERKV